MKYRMGSWALIIFMILSVLSACSSSDVSSKELPGISSDIIDTVTTSIESDPKVKDVYVGVEDDSVTIAIQVSENINKEEAKLLGENAVRLMASLSGLEAPTKDSLGELWDYYTLNVGVGLDSEDMIVQGAKVVTSRKITW